MDDLVVDAVQIHDYLVEQLENACNYNKIFVTPGFTTYYVELMLLNPKWKIGDRCDLIVERRNLEKFVKWCTYSLSLRDNVSLEILKLQRYFSYNIIRLNDAVTLKRENLKHRLQRLANEIYKFSSPASSIDDSNLGETYRQITYYITLLSGLGDPSISIVFKEAMKALTSVFDKKDFIEFAASTAEEKQDTLEQLAQLVTGIRLFNRDCNRGGQGMQDVYEILLKTSATLTETFQKMLVSIMDKVNVLTSAIDVCFKIEFQENYFNLYCIVPSGIEYSDVEKIKDTLIGYRQYEIINRKFLAEIDIIEKHSKSLFEQIHKEFRTLHNLVKYHTAIPAVTVFPIFTTISEMWSTLQDNVIKLSRIYQMSEAIKNFEQDVIVNKKVIQGMLGDNDPLTDAERLEKTTGHIIVSSNPDIEVLFPNEMPDFDKLPLKYLGFCAWKLAKSYGGLFPGNPNMGVMQYKNNYYVFSSTTAAKAFALDPDKYINKIIGVAREKPELINLLHLFDDLYEKRSYIEITAETPRRIITCDASIQTPTHFNDGKIDKNYMWNVWDLRRQALLLANMSTCKTHSSQTTKSNFKNDVKVQTYDSKEQISQTKKDNYTNVPFLSNFIYGLRGRKDDKQFIIELTRPVDE